MTQEKIVKQVLQELKELELIGIRVPKKCYEQKNIKSFFKGFEGTSRDLSKMIDIYIS